MGIIFAFIALVSWGVGDFLIQKGTRVFGNYIALFYITAIGSVAFFPFAYREIPSLLSLDTNFFLLMLTSLTILFASLLGLQALKVGKISIIEPIFALEIPMTALLAAFVIGESISLEQALLILMIIFGIIMVSTKHSAELNIKIEKGVFYAIVTAILMGSVDFLFGISSRETSPFLVNWFISAFLAIFSLLYLIFASRSDELVRCWKKEKKLIFGIGFFDNLAWIAYAYSMLSVPIAIATSISQSYLVIVASLGIILNKEKLKKHQYIGLAVTILGAIALAYITGE